MKAIRGCAWLACLIAAAFAVGADESATVTIRSVHLCCGGCTEGAKGALDGIDGVSDVKADVNSKSIVFSAKSEKAAQKGIDALAEHGFFGKAAFGKKDLAFPDAGAKKGEKRDSLTFTGVHLCCGACKKAVHEALTKLDGMTSMEIDAAAETVKLNGAGMTALDAVELLQKAGFYGKLAKPDKK
jgi:copper chaperone CopZ